MPRYSSKNRRRLVVNEAVALLNSIEQSLFNVCDYEKLFPIPKFFVLLFRLRKFFPVLYFVYYFSTLENCLRHQTLCMSSLTYKIFSSTKFHILLFQLRKFSPTINYTNFRILLFRFRKFSPTPIFTYMSILISKIFSFTNFFISLFNLENFFQHYIFYTNFFRTLSYQRNFSPQNGKKLKIFSKFTNNIQNFGNQIHAQGRKLVFENFFRSHLLTRKNVYYRMKSKIGILPFLSATTSFSVFFNT